MPKRERPKMDAYGLDGNTDGMLSWSWMCDQMRDAYSYWVCTTKPDGAPHAAPVWGVWLDETFYFATSTKSRKGRNLTHDPRVVVHLESGDETVIFEGEVSIETDIERLRQIVEVYGNKYPHTPQLPMPEDEAFYKLLPVKALAWLESDFPTTAARFSF